MSERDAIQQSLVLEATSNDMMALQRKATQVHTCIEEKELQEKWHDVLW